jgi:hypothetical protein
VLRSEDQGGRGIPVFRYDTFVQAGASQEYSFVTALPRAASYVLVHSSFRYGLHARWLEERALRLARFVGLVQFSLSHVTLPHTAQRVFDVRLQKNRTPPRTGYHKAPLPPERVYSSRATFGGASASAFGRAEASLKYFSEQERCT